LQVDPGVLVEVWRPMRNPCALTSRR
jgi:hypothetical protein